MHGGCWWALALAVVAPVVVAGPAAAETTIEVEAGYGGWFVPGKDVPVRVRIAADRLVRGSLEIGVGRPENGAPVAMAVEVPGGSQKEFILTTTAGFSENPEVTARLHQGGDLIASGQTTARATADTELVGVLPGALGGRVPPVAASLAVDAGTARFAALGEPELALGPASLGPLSTVAANADDLIRLTPAARAGILRWIEDGGRLLVDTARGEAVGGLPDAWQPGQRGRAPAGLGEVVATGGAIAAGRWSGLVEPSAWGAPSNAGRFGPDTSLPIALASDAGLRTPELGWLVAFLAVYVVAVGPALFFAVRRRGRPELAWVAVPLVALVFSSGSYLVGRDLRNATQLVHASVLSSGPGGPRATTSVGVFSRSGETARIGFPAGWTSGGFQGLGQSGPVPALVTTTAEGPDARLPLDAGQFGVVSGRGPAPGGGGGLEITASGDPNGRISGTVRNPTEFRLEDVAVFAGVEGTLVGTLGAGEERTFTLARAAQFHGPPAEFRVWGGMVPDGRGPNGNLALWQAAVSDGGMNFRAPGVVVAAGFTTDFSPELRVAGGSKRPHGQTLVLGREAVDASPDGPLELLVRRDVLRDPFTARRGFPGGRSIVRFVLPEGEDASTLVLRGQFPSPELWRDGAWEPAQCQGPDCEHVVGGQRGVADQGVIRGGPAGIELAVPPAAVRDGVLYVRVPGPASLEMPSPLTLGRSA